MGLQGLYPTYSCGMTERRVFLLVMGFAALALAVSPAFGRSVTERGPYLLVALPDLGIVTWRCDPALPGPAAGLPGLALAFRHTAQATETVRLRVGGRTVLSRVLQPGQSVKFPYLRARRQNLEIVQRTGAGTLRAFVTVEFAPGGSSTYCYRYLPPALNVRVLPRQ